MTDLFGDDQGTVLIGLHAQSEYICTHIVANISKCEDFRSLDQLNPQRNTAGQFLLLFSPVV